nr:Spliceosome-associated protein CWC15 homolog [Euglena gracilis]
MTTAHRPTWTAAIGGSNQGGNADRFKSVSRSAKDLPGQLTLKRRHDVTGVKPAAPADLKLDAKKKKEEEARKRKRPEEDADEDLQSTDEESSEDEDTLELMQELERIKKERQAEEARKERQAHEEAEKKRQEDILSGNPLIAGTAEYKVKRRWDDDVVFRNQSRTEPLAKKRFINDVLRSDFHRRFMNKYVK